MPERVLGVIPARYGSTRLPGKALADILGKPMIQHVYERVIQAKTLDRAIVATDDERIAEAVRSFGGSVVMTSPDHPSGSDRVAEVVADLECDLVINIQGDEPEIEPDSIDLLAKLLAEDPDCRMATLACPFAKIPGGDLNMICFEKDNIPDNLGLTEVKSMSDITTGKMAWIQRDVLEIPR